MQVGLRSGLRPGLRVGLNANDVPVDPESGLVFPLTQAEIDAVLDAAGVTKKTASHSHGMQDTSGASAVATIGTSWTITGTVGYQQDLAGMARNALEIDATAGERIAHAAGVGLNPATGSVMRWCIIDQPSAPGANSTLWALSLNAANFSVIGLTTSLLRVSVNAVTTDGAVNHVTGGPYIVCTVYDKAISLAAVYTDREKIIATYSAAVADGAKGYGTTATPAPLKVGWDMEFGGAQAEWGASRIAVETAIKSVMRAMGFSPTWSPS